MEGPYIVFDVETPNAANDRISAIGVTVVSGGRITESFATLVDPEAPFDPFNIALTGITPAAVLGKPNFPALWARLAGLFSSGVLVAHNAPFDLGVLAKCLRDYGIAWKQEAAYLCTCQMGRTCLPDAPNHKLNTLCALLHIPLDHHDAGSDSRACAALLQHYLARGWDPARYLRRYDVAARRTLPQRPGKALAFPPAACQALQRLRERGHSAYFVGGCVRDALRGQTPADFDLATSATPEEVAACFDRVIATGLQHGTVTVLQGGLALEVTTYRLEGTYSDCRHPDAVRFTRDIIEDLARRDFTINAMAYAPGEGLLDPFGGQQDLARGVIRCVGDPMRRMTEDALRILRALRFSAVLGFCIDPATARAAFCQRGLLARVSKERIASELCKLLCGRAAGRVLLEFPQVLAVFLPELEAQVGFDQCNPHHSFDLYTHTARTVAGVPQEAPLRLAALLHDIAKPACFTKDEDGIGHFYGHAAQGAAMAEEITHRLRLDSATCTRVTQLVKWHDTQINPEARAVKRALRRMTPPVLFQLLALQRADRRGAKIESVDLSDLDEVQALAEEILREDACFSLRDLAVNGNDLLQAGIAPGKPVGAALAGLLDAVIDGKAENTKQALLAYLKTMPQTPESEA